MSTTIETSGLVNQLLAKCNVKPDMFDDYKASHAAMAGQYQWHGQDDIQTMTGLPGTYLWTENLPQMQQITFRFVPATSYSDGIYTLVQGTSVVEKGAFHCCPNNPAVGWAFIVLEPDHGDNRVCNILGMLTDTNWKIMNMVMMHCGEHGVVLPMFSAVRTGP